MPFRGPAPVVLFVYNRPGHTRRTLEALARNPEAGKTTLYIFCDGAKFGATEEELAAIAEVRRIVAVRKWCDTVEIRRSEINLGLAASIVRGVTQVVNQNGRVIVLEDDIEVTAGFLKYMNEALDIYAADERVFQVSAFMVPARFLAATGMLRVSTSWGWATWDRAWLHYSDDATALRDQIGEGGRKRFDLDGCSFHFEELGKNVSGELRTWAVKWYASIFLQNGLCLYPHRPLVLNVGFDGSGVHCHNDVSGTSVSPKTVAAIRVRRVPLEEDPRYLRATQTYYRTLLQTWTGTRLRDRVFSKLRRIFPIRPDGHARQAKEQSR